jgi:hypothetical protein
MLPRRSAAFYLEFPVRTAPVGCASRYDLHSSDSAACFSAAFRRFSSEVMYRRITSASINLPSGPKGAANFSSSRTRVPSSIAAKWCSCSYRAKIPSVMISRKCENGLDTSTSEVCVNRSIKCRARHFTVSPSCKRPLVTPETGFSFIGRAEAIWNSMLVASLKHRSSGALTHVFNLIVTIAPIHVLEPFRPAGAPFRFRPFLQQLVPLQPRPAEPSGRSESPASLRRHPPPGFAAQPYPDASQQQ